MNVSRVIKLVPNAILLAFVAYAAVSLQSAHPDAGASQTELAKGLDLMIQDLTIESVGVLDQVKLRDPFLPVAPAAAIAEAAAADAPADPKDDPLVDVVAGLSLDATIIHGRDQFAIIDGRIYNKGQRLVLPGDNRSQPPLVVLFVKPTGVILRGGGKNYLLGYPEQLGRKRETKDDSAERAADTTTLDPAGQSAMFQKLLGSPLGTFGKSLIGMPGRSPSDAQRGAARKSSGSRGAPP